MNHSIAARIALGICAAAAAGTALADAPVALDSAVFVERMGAAGSRSLEPANRLIRGDRVVTVLSWQRLGRSSPSKVFTLVNPLPSAIAYQASARDGEEVSVDGARTWGTIGTLRFGTRMATPEDVTHVRWRLPSSAGSGSIAYSGIVR